MPDLDLDAIQKRAEAATPGPWYVGQNPDYGFDEAVWSGGSDIHEIVCTRNLTPMNQDQLVSGNHVIPLGPSLEWEKRDGYFIAEARTDVPALIAEVRRLQAQINAAPHGYDCDEMWRLGDCNCWKSADLG